MNAALPADPKTLFAFFAIVFVTACRALACGAEVSGVLLVMAVLLCLGLAQPSDASSG